MWVADYALSSAEQGAGGINVFGQIPPDPESPINADGSPRPTYYGLLFFHNAAPGNSKIVPININTSMNITAHATMGVDGKLRVALINKDQSHSATLQINTGQTYAKASALRMTAPSMSSTSGIAFGGAAVAANGTWRPQTVEAVAVNGANSSIHLPAASAVVITYENSENPSRTAPAISPVLTPHFSAIPAHFCLGACPMLLPSPSSVPLDTPANAPPASVDTQPPNHQNSFLDAPAFRPDSYPHFTK